MANWSALTRPATGRILGLDAGDRRIGVAISDPEQRLALPLHSVVRDGRGGELAAIEALVASEEVVELVVGLPLSLSGEAGPQAESARAFAQGLEARLKLPVRLWDERLSTREAEQRMSNQRPGRRREQSRRQQVDVDAIAASIILQAYLDSLRVGPRE
jgi:putative Holliday junction resolvase